ncbi:hypothetical protein TWF730_007257 [Orbilia blumenaviensis]|uniref:Uncharacterized protein n=1 Tax=Orbilia blumenaviensis TaxID=1796055 RepID=A0AAV9V7C4_9PEZI
MHSRKYQHHPQYLYRDGIESTTMTHPKLIVFIITGLAYYTSSTIAQSTEVSKRQDGTHSSPCIVIKGRNNNTNTKVNPPPFVDVSNSEPNAASEPGPRSVADQDDTEGN